MFPYIYSLIWVFIINMLTLVKYVFWIYQDDHIIFFFLLLILWIILIDFLMLTQTCIPRINPKYHNMLSFLICCQILLTSTLTRIFAAIFMGDDDFDFSFFVIFARVWYQSDAGLTKSVRKCSLFWCFLEDLWN